MKDHALLLGAALTLLIAIALIVLWIQPAQKEAGGIAQKIFYFHVCGAWTSFHAFLLALWAGVAYLRKPHPGWDRLGAVAVEVGMLFCTMVVVTGPVWARPVWGHYWSTEPRLLTFTAMWFSYAGYLILRQAMEGSPRRAPICAVYCVVASVNVPMVYFAVKMGLGNHPESIGLTNPMRIVLYTTLFAFTLLWIALTAIRWRIQVASDRLTEAGV